MKKRKVSIEELATLLEAKGLTAKQVDEMLRSNERKLDIHEVERKVKGTYRFGIISDTHLISKQCALAELHNFYKKCKEAGIKEIFHAGDLADGQGVYTGQNNELVCWGADAHLAFVVENYPKVEGVTTYVISGNHEESYQKHFGVDFLKLVASQRTDIKYLGFYNAQIRMANGLLIELQHGAGGSSYAVSYKLQRYITALSTGKKPNIYILGHFHGAFYFFYRNIHAFLPGAWQRANNFTKRLGLHESIGGWIVEVEIADDKRSSVKRIKTEFIPYYRQEDAECSPSGSSSARDSATGVGKKKDSW